MIAEFHELLPVSEVRAQSAGSTAVNAELAFETADEDVMVDGIKGRLDVRG